MPWRSCYITTTSNFSLHCVSLDTPVSVNFIWFKFLCIVLSTLIFSASLALCARYWWPPPHKVSVISLQWRHNHQPHHYLLNRVFRRRPKKTSKLRVTGLCAENSPVTGEFSVHMVSNADVSIWWRHHDVTLMFLCTFAKSNCKIYIKIAGKIKCHNDHVMSSKCVICHCLVFNWMPNWMCQPKLFLMCWYAELFRPAWCHVYHIWWEVNHFGPKMYCMKTNDFYCSFNHWND